MSGIQENVRDHVWDLLEGAYEDSKLGSKCCRELLLDHWDDLSALYLMLDWPAKPADREVLLSFRKELSDAIEADFPTRSEIPDMKALGLGEVTVGEFLKRRDEEYRPEGEGWERCGDSSTWSKSVSRETPALESTEED